MKISLQLRPDVTHQMRALRVTLSISSPRTQCVGSFASYLLAAITSVLRELDLRPRVLWVLKYSNGACHDIIAWLMAWLKVVVY